MKLMRLKEESMKKKDGAAAPLPQMPGGGVPVPQENFVRVTGRLVKQAMAREVTGGTKMATFMLKVPRTYHTADRKAEENAFVPVVAWRSIAERAAQLGKDSAVSVEGYLQTWARPEGKGFRWQVVAEGFEVLDAQAPMRDAGRQAPKEEAVAAA
jgi:single-stranded DNA-binding protein